MVAQSRLPSQPAEPAAVRSIIYPERVSGPLSAQLEKMNARQLAQALALPAQISGFGPAAGTSIVGLLSRRARKRAQVARSVARVEHPPEVVDQEILGRAIDNALAVLLRAPDRAARMSACSVMNALIRLRSPERIAEMERRRGLR